MVRKNILFLEFIPKIFSEAQEKKKSLRASVAKRQSVAKQRHSLKRTSTRNTLIADDEEEEEDGEEKVVTLADYTLRDPLLFGDYRNAVNESEPRFYEDLLDYKAIYFLFQEVNKTKSTE